MRTANSVADEVFKRTQARVLDRENWEKRVREKDEEGKRLMEAKKKFDDVSWSFSSIAKGRF